MSYTPHDLLNLQEFYRKQLLEDTMAFWFPRAIDPTHGGYLLMRDLDGKLLDEDKSVWFQGRTAWTLATIYQTIDSNPFWLSAAKSGIDFINQHCFDQDERMFFHVTRSGEAIRKRRYYFSETFACIAHAAFANASGDAPSAERAKWLFGKCIHYWENPSILEAKFTNVRPGRSIGPPMIMLNTAQQMRQHLDDPRCSQIIDRCISEISTYFVKDDLQVVMELVAPDGSVMDHLDGRMLNPGHAIEGAWFILHEAKYRNNDPELIRLGCKMLDYMWTRGWDQEYQGLYYYRDVYHRPVQEYWHDMKFWWPHNEAIIATLLAYTLTGDKKYAHMHQMVHQYAYSHFHDKENGEWFGYLHRDGTISQTAKGNLFKGPFHLPRQEWYCTLLLQDYIEKNHPQLSDLNKKP